MKDLKFSEGYLTAPLCFQIGLSISAITMTAPLSQTDLFADHNCNQEAMTFILDIFIHIYS